MLSLAYKYWLKSYGDNNEYEFIERCKEFRTINNAVDHLDLLKRTWGKHLISVKLEFDLYSGNFDPKQFVIKDIRDTDE